MLNFEKYLIMSQLIKCLKCRQIFFKIILIFRRITDFLQLPRVLLIVAFYLLYILPFVHKP